MPPSITLVGRSLQNKAWKVDGKKMENLCQNFPTNETIRCIEENSYDKEEIVKDVQFTRPFKENPDDNMTSDFTKVNHGRSLTWSSVTMLKHNERITFSLFRNKSYIFFIHDKDYFVNSLVPKSSGLPSIYLKVVPPFEGGNCYYRTSLVETQL